MKYIKKFEEHKIDKYLLCVKSTDPHFYWKFTAGKKYKLYFSTLGVRVKDDKNKFWNIDFHVTSKDTLKNKIIEFEYADGIFTSDNTIEEYEIRKNTEKYNL